MCQASDNFSSTFFGCLALHVFLSVDIANGLLPTIALVNLKLVAAVGTNVICIPSSDTIFSLLLTVQIIMMNLTPGICKNKVSNKNNDKMGLMYAW